MALKKTISGFRGTIGGDCSDNLTPLNVVRFTTAYCTWLASQDVPQKIVIGRDARLSGEMINGLVVNTILGMGIDVVDLGLSTTPTVEMAVVWEQAGGGIILTASHNPKQWNALKLLNSKGEFIDQDNAQKVLDIVDEECYNYADVDHLGKYSTNYSYLQKHIDAIVNHKFVDKDAIAAKNFTVLVDGINSSGGVAIPALLKALGVNKVIEENCSPTGHFAHNPEPLAENLVNTVDRLKKENADLGIVVDPDVDRLCFINEDGTLFGEEYTLVAIADYVLGQVGGGNTVSNLSSTIALRQITEKHGGEYSSAAVGEVNVVQKMKDTNAVIGGEGNGGIIYPDFHYGRDALVGIGLFLTQLAKSGKTCSELRGEYPNLYISKNKIELKDLQDKIQVETGLQGDALKVKVKAKIKDIQDQLAKKYNEQEQNREDGLKIYFEGSDWVHLRESNTEPIMRVYSESENEEQANAIADKMKNDVNTILA